MNVTREGIGSAGLQPAGLIFGGSASPKQQTESWNGSSWANENILNTARSDTAGSGTSTLALCFGGRPPTTDATEEWNGEGLFSRTVTTD